jgi:hypothetical protein
MNIEVGIGEQILTGLFHVHASNRDNRRQFKISENEKDYAYCGESITLEEAIKEKEQLINSLKSFKYTVKDVGVNTMLHNPQPGIKVKLKNGRLFNGELNGKHICMKNGDKENRIWMLTNKTTEDQFAEVTCININNSTEVFKIGVGILCMNYEEI